MAIYSLFACLLLPVEPLAALAWNDPLTMRKRVWVDVLDSTAASESRRHDGSSQFPQASPRRIWLAIVLVVCLFLPTVDTDASNWLQALNSGRALVTTLAVATITYLVGTSVTRRFVDFGSAPPTFFLGANFILGGAVLGAVLMTLGLIGLFDPITVRVAVVAGLLLVWRPKILADATTTALGFKAEMATFLSSKGRRIVALFLSSLMIVFLLASLGPTVGWDEAMYHLDLPLEYLANGRIYLPDDNLHAAYIATPHMLSAVLLAAGAEAGPAVLHWISSVMVIAVLASGGRALFGAKVGLFAALAGFSIPAIFRLGSQAMTDTHLVLVVLVIVLWISQLDREAPNRIIPLLGLLCAAGFLIKYQAIPYIVGALVAMFILYREEMRDVRAQTWLLSIGLFSILISPFLIKNWVLIGAPLYPFLSEYRYPAWIGEKILGGDVTELSGPYGVLGSSREPFTPWSWLLAPETLSVEAAAGWTRFPYTFLAFPLAFLSRRRKEMILVLLPALVGVVGIVAVSPRTNTRYLLPCLALLTLVIGLAVAVVMKVFSGSRRRLVAVLLVLILVAPTVSLVLFDTRSSGRIEQAVGMASSFEWMNGQHDLGQGSHLRLLNLNSLLLQEMELGDRALLLLDARGGHFEVPVIQDNADSNWLMLEEIIDGSCFETNAFTHVVWNLDVQRYLAERGVPDSLLARDRFEGYARSCLELIAAPPGFEVYEVKTSVE